MKVLHLNKDIYSIARIKNAVLAFKDYADMGITEHKEYIYVSFLQCKYDESITVKEFENYLIGLENL